MKKTRGFTLVELMITVAIVAILASIAYPSYTQYTVRSNRSSAVSFVMNLASRQEQYNLDARLYTNQMSLLGAATVPTEVSNKYNVTVAVDNTLAPPIYNVTATPTGTQLAQDTQCGTLNIDQTGLRTISGTSTVSKCW
ncbi:MAG: type IV pilin protein [Candidatus Saccharibacteria bacterium]|nr:type IV pilin protein [Rhodoferax sp.]